MSKVGWIIGTVLGGSALAYLLWPRDAQASTVQATPLPRGAEPPLQAAQQMMDERELPPTPAPKPASPKPTAVKKPAPKKTKPVAATPLTVDQQIAQMRLAQQQYEVERDTAASMAMKEQIAQVLQKEIQKAEQAGDTVRRDRLRDELAFMRQ